MRTQAQSRFTGQADWKAGRVSSATEEVIAAIAKERAVPEPILSNEVNTPHINVITIACIAFACEVCLVIGFYIGWAVTRGY